MIEKDDLPMAWCVVCEHYVSRHDDKANAVLHMRKLRDVNSCKATHYVEMSTEPTGTRHRNA